MLLYHGSRMELSELLPGSTLCETHEEATRRAQACLAKGDARVYFVELDPSEVMFEGELGYLVYNRKPASWHRVGK